MTISFIEVLLGIVLLLASARHVLGSHRHYGQHLMLCTAVQSLLYGRHLLEIIMEIYEDEMT